MVIITISKQKKYDLIKIKGLTNFNGFNYKLPGDISSSAFFIVLTALTPKSELTITKKQYYVTGKKRNVKLCCMKEGNDLWWPLQRPEQPETSYKVQVKPTVTSNYTGDGKTA